MQIELYYIYFLGTFQASWNTGTPYRFLQFINPESICRLPGLLLAHSIPMDTRESSAKRGYGSRWQKARAGFLRSHPLCSDHQKRGHIVEATVVDHIVPHRGNSELFWDSGNWQSLCKLCHDGHKQRLEKGGAVTGCDLSGLPLDPSHHWSTKAGGGG